MLSACRLQFIISHLSLLVLEFHQIHLPRDFGFSVLFPHIISILHCNSKETSWFSLMIHESQLTEEKSVQSSVHLESCRPGQDLANWYVPERTGTYLDVPVHGNASKYRISPTGTKPVQDSTEFPPVWFKSVQHGKTQNKSSSYRWGTVQVSTGFPGSVQNSIRRYKSVHDFFRFGTGRYKSVQDFPNRYKTVQDGTRQYMTSAFFFFSMVWMQPVHFEG